MSALIDQRHPSWFGRAGVALLKACADTAYYRKWVVIAVSLLLTALTGYLATRLTITTATEDILSPDLRFFQIERNYRQAFPEQNMLVVVVDANTASEARAAALALAERLEPLDNRFEAVETPSASPYFARHGLLFLELEKLRAMLDQLGRAQPVLSIFAKDPSLRGLAEFMRLVGLGATAGAVTPELTQTLEQLAATTAARAEGRPATMHWDTLFDFGPASARTRALVLTKPVVSESSLKGAQPALTQLRSEIAAVQADHPDIRVRITGLPALLQQELNDAFSGALYASGLSFILVTLSLFLLRSWRLVLALVVTLIIGSIWTTGLAAVSVGRLNLISIAFLVLFFGLGVDFGTHLGLRYLEETRAGASFHQAITRALVGEGPSITLGALCASIGFLSFVPTAYVGLAEFGIISAIGMVIAVIVTFTLQPALMAVMPPRPKAEMGIRFGLGNLIRGHHRAILVATTVVTIAAAVAASQVRVDVNPLNLQNPAAEAVQTYRDLAKDSETTPYALNVLAPYIGAGRELASRLAKIEGVAGTRTVESFVPVNQPPKLELIRNAARRLAPVFQIQVREPQLSNEELTKAFTDLRTRAAELASAGQQNAQFSEAARRLAAALDRFAEARGVAPSALRDLDQALTGSMPALVQMLKASLSVADEVSISDLPQNIRRDWVAPDGRVRIQILPAGGIVATEQLEAFARNVQAAAPEATGLPINISEAGAAVTRAFATAITITAIAIALLILLLRRRLSDVFLVLAPLALASLWTVAGAAVIGMPFNFANVIVIPLLIGLGVASSIHIVDRARQMPVLAGDNTEHDFLDSSTPLAVFIAQLNTAAAFATLAISDHRGLYSMGVLLGMAILFVLIASLVVLPAGIVSLRSWKHERKVAP